MFMPSEYQHQTYSLAYQEQHQDSLRMLFGDLDQQNHLTFPDFSRHFFTL